MAKDPEVMDPVDSAVSDEEPAAMLPAVSELVPALIVPEKMDPAVMAPAVVKFKLLATTFPT
jgi:hypothetical protein